MKWMILSAIALSFIGLGACANAREQGPVTSSDEACDRVIDAVLARGDYTKSQIAGCWGDDDDDPDQDYYLLRLNAPCHEEFCGSVLLGWFAVKKETGKVYDWDIAEDAMGGEVLPKH